MRNWSQLVSKGVQAEIPDFEVQTTLASFLDCLESNKVGDDILTRVGKFFGFPKDAWRPFGDGL